MQRVRRFAITVFAVAALVGATAGAEAGTVEDRDKISSGQQQTTSGR